MLNKKTVLNKADTCFSQHEEYEDECYCSECGKYLGSTNFTYKRSHSKVFDGEAMFCKYCGSSLFHY